MFVHNVFFWLKEKDNQEWLNWINQGKARYLNKNKLQELINQQRTNLAEVEYLDLKPVESILQQNPAVNDLFLEDDYIEKMNRHNAMLGNQNAKKDFTEEQQKEYDKTKKWNGYWHICMICFKSLCQKKQKKNN